MKGIVNKLKTSGKYQVIVKYLTIPVENARKYPAKYPGKYQ